MKQRPRRVLLHKLLLSGNRNRQFWPAVVLLCIAVTLMLCSVMLWAGYKDLLTGEYDNDSIGSAYLTISKEIPVDEKITEQKPQRFTVTEVRALNALPEVSDVGLFTAALFPVTVTLEGDGASFTTDLFVESVPERFIDNKPLDWQWESRNAEVPVIVSTEFLNLYNHGYAPNQGVPQITTGTIKSLEFSLTIGSGINTETFKARVAGFSDRISSILVPENFIAYGNKFYSDEQAVMPTRLIAEVTDPSANEFVSFIVARDYVVNKEQLRKNRMRTVVALAVKGIAALSCILLLFGCFAFYLYLANAFAKVGPNISLLLELGYSPRFLQRFLYIRLSLILLLVAIVCGVLAVIIQVRVAKYALGNELQINTFPSWEVWTALTAIILFFVVSLYLYVTHSINKNSPAMSEA